MLGGGLRGHCGRLLAGGFAGAGSAARCTVGPWIGADVAALSLQVRKWQSLIEAHVDVKTTDGYVLRMFCVAFTKKRQNQMKKTCYAQSAQIRQIRKKMVEIMKREAESDDLKSLVAKLCVQHRASIRRRSRCSHRVPCVSQYPGVDRQGH